MAPLLAVAVVSLAALGFAAPSAMALKPTGGFVNFGDCPTKNAEVSQCVYGLTSSGKFTIGSTEVPIAKTITLQGGIIEHGEIGNETFVNATDGNTISKTPQTVPGGLLKIIAPKEWPEILQFIFNEFINKGITGVTETTEQAGTIGINRLALLTTSGTALTLPTRVHLENSFLGNNCYIGSSAHPVNVELTTGTTPNGALTGNLGEPEFKEEGEILVLKKNSLVNSTFVAPEAEGCGSQILFGLFTGVIDKAVDSEIGLPSGSGSNQAVLTGTLEDGNAEAVRKSEK
jgi:hypothetical protein